MNTIVAVDPGKTSGIAHYPAFKTFTAHSLVGVMDVIEAFAPDILIAEAYNDYSTYPNPNSRYPIEIIGALKYYARRHNSRTRLIIQTPYQRKGLRKKDVIEATKFDPQNDHETDAMLHLMVYLMKERNKWQG